MPLHFLERPGGKPLKPTRALRPQARASTLAGQWRMRHAALVVGLGSLLWASLASAQQSPSPQPSASAQPSPPPSASEPAAPNAPAQPEPRQPGAAPNAPSNAPPSSEPSAPANELPPPSSPETTTPAAPALAQIEPPRVVSRVEPNVAAGSRQVRGEVLLEVTVGVDGNVVAANVERSLQPELDQAALEAVRQWRFTPAQRAGRAVAARIRVPFTFGDAPVVPVTSAQPTAPVANAPPAAPATPLPATAAAAPAKTASPAPAETPPPTEATQVLIQGQRAPRAEQRSASDFHIDHDVLRAAPRHEGVDVLRTAPGLYLARSEGNAVAHRYMLRGFDSDHGQDIEFRVAGIPINLPSHIHGQGYADLNFLIAETVDELRVTEGVHDPRQGDFAVAGSMDLRLGVRRRGVLLKTGYGSFGSLRQLLLWAPKEQLRDSFAAVALQHTDGFGQNRRGQGASAIVQQGWTHDRFRLRGVGILYAARSDSAGVLRADDIASGRVGRLDVYPYATAQAQNALAGRALLGAFADYRAASGENAELGVWFGYDNFRLQENFTGFVQRSQALGGITGQGDLIEQRNRTESVGVSSRYHTAAAELMGELGAALELGFSGRVDAIEQSQNLLNATVRGQTWDERIDAEVRALDIGAFGDLDLHWGERFKLRMGFRADALSYDINDRLGNRAPATRPDDTFIVGFRRSAFGIVAGPRVSSDAAVTPWLNLHASYGEGYRSPQARLLADGERAPFAKVRAADLGARIHNGERFELSLSGYHTNLSDDVAFEAEEGSLQRVGATRRRGAVLHAVLRPLTGLVAAGSVTYVDAELLEPPPASPEQPDPPFRAGQNLPFVPPIVARADVGYSRPLWTLSNSNTLEGKLGAGLSVLSERPLPYGQFARAFALLDLSAAIALEPVELGFEVFNVLDSEYSAVEYSFVSNWDPENAGSRLPARHSSAGSPRTLMATLELQL